MFTDLTESQSYFLFAITATGVVPCGGPKMSRRTSAILPIIFCSWSFEISVDILRNQKFIIGLDSFKLAFNILDPIWIILVFFADYLLESC